MKAPKKKFKGYEGCQTCDGFGYRVLFAEGQSLNAEAAVAWGVGGAQTQCPSCAERAAVEAALAGAAV